MSTKPSTVLLWVAFLSSRVLVFTFLTRSGGDVSVYHEFAKKAWETGNPYLGEGFGYPPLAFFYVALPYLVARDLPDYYQLYRAETYLVDLALFALLMRRGDGSRLPALTYLVSTTLLGNLLYHRLDLVLGLLLLGAVSLRERGRIAPSYLLLGLAGAFKVVPLAAAPALLLFEARRSRRGAVTALSFLTLGAGAPTLIAVLLWGEGAVGFLGGHAERGVEIESSWASVESLLLLFGLEGTSYWGAGCYNLRTAAEPLFVTLSHVASLLVVGGSCLLGLRATGATRNPLWLLTITLAAILSVSKVFSPQFLLFLLPLVSAFANREGGMLHIPLLFIGIAALTTWVYPYRESELVALEGGTLLLVSLRNVIFLGFVLLLIRAFRREEKEAVGEA
jgi:hypothetical protein